MTCRFVFACLISLGILTAPGLAHAVEQYDFLVDKPFQPAAIVLPTEDGWAPTWTGPHSFFVTHSAASVTVIVQRFHTGTWSNVLTQTINLGHDEPITVNVEANWRYRYVVHSSDFWPDTIGLHIKPPPSPGVPWAFMHRKYLPATGQVSTYEFIARTTNATSATSSVSAWVECLPHNGGFFDCDLYLERLVGGEWLVVGRSERAGGNVATYDWVDYLPGDALARYRWKVVSYRGSGTVNLVME